MINNSKEKKMKIYRDGLEEIADRKPRVSKTRDGHTVESYSVKGVKRYFVTLKDTFWCAHGSTVAEAVADAIWKDPKRRPPLEKLKADIQKDGEDRLISLNEFKVLTGACSEGCRVALKKAGLNGSPMKAKDIRDKVSAEWGEKLIEILEWSIPRTPQEPG